MNRNRKPVVLAFSNPLIGFRLTSAVVLLLGGFGLFALPASAQLVANNTPRFTSTAKIVASEDPAKVIEVSIWLKPHNAAEIDALAAKLYDPASSIYRQFLNRSEFEARFAPTAAEAEKVETYFHDHGMSVVKVGPGNFFVRASGTIAQFQSAFHVTLNDYQVGSKVVRANDRNPFIEPSIAPVVRTVSGLDTGEFVHPLVVRPTIPAKRNVKSSNGPADLTASSKIPPGFFTNVCLGGSETETFSTDNNGSVPVGTFSGNLLNLPGLYSPGCGYTPPEIQTAYKLSSLYAKSFDGTGQTIGIIDWCGSSTILHDANVFSTTFGLPALKLGDNFNIIYTPTASLCVGIENVEINLDVEWAHAVAPGANINLIVPPGADFQDIDQAELTAIEGGLANVISGSYGALEYYVSQSELDTGNLINEIAGIQGVSANFSTGDEGDNVAYDNGIPTVNYPADTPYATAVGGSSLALKANNSIAAQYGWGNNTFLLAEDGYVADPPTGSYFEFGAGGGPSMCAVQTPSGGCISGFPKPSYQEKLPGKVRLLPDVAWLADPYMGVVVYVTTPGTYPGYTWEVIGGTSVAAPMFSALWAISNQEAGAPLGQAAPYLYSMPADTITDIKPSSSATSVKAKITDSAGIAKYTAAQVAGITGPFMSGMWNYPASPSTLLGVTFGTDSSLVVKEGWDEVTGVGVPNGATFADYFLYGPGTFVKPEAIDTP